MRILVLLLAAGLLASMALAQVTTPPATVTTEVTVTEVAPGTVVCPSPFMTSEPCAAIAVPGVGGETVILVLGSEEHYALTNLAVEDLGWRDVPSNYTSKFEVGNPISFHKPNLNVPRHGNPYFPYFQLGPNANLTRSMAECFPIQK